MGGCKRLGTVGDCVSIVLIRDFYRGIDGGYGGYGMQVSLNFSIHRRIEAHADLTLWM